MPVDAEGQQPADEIDARILALPYASTEPIRSIRREFSKRLKNAPAARMLDVVAALLPRHRWVAYELLYHHPAALSSLRSDDVERLGHGMASWDAVDTFGRYISGPAWQRGQIGDDVVIRWAASDDRWWRRAALVSTVVLNLRAAGGTGDAARTLDICSRLVADRDDMVVKGLSWALRELVIWDPDAVRGFLDEHQGNVAARVRREVNNKIDTGLKNPTHA
jgi:3-methyladenine DNA glycosylase AlkD